MYNCKNKKKVHMCFIKFNTMVNTPRTLKDSPYKNINLSFETEEHLFFYFPQRHTFILYFI